MNPILSFAEGESGSGLKFGSALRFRARWWLFFSPRCCPRSTRLLRALAQSRIPISTTPVRPLLAMKSLSSMVWARTFAMTRLGKYEEWGEVTRWASVCKNERKLGSRGLPQPFLPRNYRDGTEAPPQPTPPHHGTDSACASRAYLKAHCARLLLQFPRPAGLWYWHW